LLIFVGLFPKSRIIEACDRNTLIRFFRTLILELVEACTHITFFQGIRIQ